MLKIIGGILKRAFGEKASDTHSTGHLNRVTARLEFMGYRQSPEYPDYIKPAAHEGGPLHMAIMRCGVPGELAANDRIVIRQFYNPDMGACQEFKPVETISVRDFLAKSDVHVLTGVRLIDMGYCPDPTLNQYKYIKSASSAGQPLHMADLLPTGLDGELLPDDMIVIKEFYNPDMDVCQQFKIVERISVSEFLASAQPHQSPAALPGLGLGQK